MAKRILLVITDTQPTWFIGAYGNGDSCGTPHLDRLAEEGVCYQRAYTTCPLCTPARGAIFSGLYPASCGAVSNESSPFSHVPLLGTRLKEAGITYGYTGKWHLDGAGYHGNGKPGGGAPASWWYDGECYLQEVGRERYASLAQAAGSGDADRLEELNLQPSEIWGERLVEKTEEFFQQVDTDEEFLFTVSFDEPHGPFICPPEFFREAATAMIPPDPSHGEPVEDTRPQLQRQQSREFPVGEAQEYAAQRIKHMACSRYVDHLIGKLRKLCTRYFEDDILVIFTSDHGDMHGAHGLRTKGAQMYEQTVRVPLIISGPGFPQAKQVSHVVSHLDIVPTVLEYFSKPVPPSLHGQSLLAFPDASRALMLQFFRFGTFHDGLGEFYPIRAIVTDRYKLSLNLFDSDELYDLKEDPKEEVNLLYEVNSEARRIASGLARELEALMDKSFDPLRGVPWRVREWMGLGPEEIQKRRKGFFRQAEHEVPPL